MMILGLKERDFLSHYVTVNECLGKLDHSELEKIRKEMIYGLIRKKGFNDARFLGEHWLVIVDATQLSRFKERHCEHCLTKIFMAVMNRMAGEFAVTGRKRWPIENEGFNIEKNYWYFITHATKQEC